MTERKDCRRFRIVTAKNDAETTAKFLSTFNSQYQNGEISRPEFDLYTVAVLEDTELNGFSKCDGNCAECNQKPISLIDAATIAEHAELQYVEGHISKEQFKTIKDFIGKSLDRAPVKAYIHNITQGRE